jgi:hypothetical protein
MCVSLMLGKREEEEDDDDDGDEEKEAFLIMFSSQLYIVPCVIHDHHHSAAAAKKKKRVVWQGFVANLLLITCFQSLHCPLGFLVGFFWKFVKELIGCSGDGNCSNIFVFVLAN